MEFSAKLSGILLYDYHYSEKKPSYLRERKQRNYYTEMT